MGGGYRQREPSVAWLSRVAVVLHASLGAFSSVVEGFRDYCWMGSDGVCRRGLKNRPEREGFLLKLQAFAKE